MIDFIMAHPYLTIWVFLVVMFERAGYCGLVVDDDVRHKVVQDIKKGVREKKTSFLRLVRESMYGAGLFYNPTLDHFATVFVHGLNCSLIYRMTGSLWVTLLYLVNPINNQTVLWLNGRRYALSVLLVLLAWNFWPLAPVLSLAVAMLHVSGMMLPFLFLWTPFWPWVLPVAALAALVSHKWIIQRFKDRKADFKEGHLEVQRLRPRKIILFIKTVGYHFQNCIWPDKPAMYHNFLFYFSATQEGTDDGYRINFDFWRGVVVLAFLAYDHSFAAFWFLLFIAQWCNLYQVTMNASDRYTCLANIGAMMLLVKYVMMLPLEIRYYVLMAFGIFYVVKYQPLFFAYRKLENFYQYHVFTRPDTINPRYFLYKLYLRKGDPFQAFAMIRQGMRYHPHDFKLMLGFIECMFKLGKPKSGLKAMEICEKYIPFGEEEDTKHLFDGIRKQFKAEYDAIQREKDEIDRMTPDQLFEERIKIIKKESKLPLSKREKVMALCKKIDGVKVGTKS